MADTDDLLRRARVSIVRLQQLLGYDGSSAGALGAAALLVVTSVEEYVKSRDNPQEEP